MKTIQFLCPNKLLDRCEIIIKELERQDYQVVVNPATFDPNELAIAAFCKNMEAEKYLKHIPILEDQLNYSSIPYLRILPLLIYDGAIDDPEQIYEEGLGDEVEAVFSGEFKPFGWDESKNNNIVELVRIIEENYEE